MSASREDDPLSGINVSEANAKIPRKARLDDDIVSALGFMLFFFVLWLVPAAWGAYVDLGGSHIRDSLRQEGSAANAEIIESHATRSGADVVYRFSVDGVSYSGRARIVADNYKIQTHGEKIPIRYLPKDPRVNQPVDWGWFSVGWAMFYSLGLVILVVAGVVVTGGLRQKELMRVGTVVEGKVTGCAPDRSLFKVYYEFTTENNVSMEGSARMSEECEAGSSIPVMYLRNNPRRNDFYPE
jgi:hypothetical protein